MASLVISRGANEGNYYPLGKRTTVIGRDESLMVQVLDEKVSRKHCQVRFDEGSNSYKLFDMKSANGTAINGRAVTDEITLVDGDRIDIGDTHLLFSTEDFDDRDSAMEHFRKVGERHRSTLIR